MCSQNLDNPINWCSMGAALLHLDNAFIFHLEHIICCFQSTLFQLNFLPDIKVLDHG